MDIIDKHFPELNLEQRTKYEMLLNVFPVLNNDINLISRKDIDSLETKHLLHSLALVKTGLIGHQKKILDIGTGGGFPGLILAIYYPQIHFTLSDSILKKTRAVQSLIDQLELNNCTVIRSRAEQINDVFDLVVNRAVAPLYQLHSWISTKINRDSKIQMLSLKGGNLDTEIFECLQGFKKLKIEKLSIIDYYKYDWFETKYIVVSRLKSSF